MKTSLNPSKLCPARFCLERQKKVRLFSPSLEIPRSRSDEKIAPRFPQKHFQQSTQRLKPRLYGLREIVIEVNPSY